MKEYKPICTTFWYQLDVTSVYTVFISYVYTMNRMYTISKFTGSNSGAATDYTQEFPSLIGAFSMSSLFRE